MRLRFLCKVSLLQNFIAVDVTMHNRKASLLIAALLPLLLFGWFTPTPTGQIDFWLMWLVAMFAVGLPLLYAEVGLAYRSQQTPAIGIQALTRQADTSTVWRNFVWLTVVMALIISALSIDAVASNLLDTMAKIGIVVEVPDFALSLAMVVIAGILSLIGVSTLFAAVLLLALSFVIAAVTNMPDVAFNMTEATLGEWARAVILALVSVGVGTGLYWFNSPLVGSLNQREETTQSSRVQQIASKSVFPIWLTQLVIGSIALVFTKAALSPVAMLTYALGVLASAAFLMHYANTQLATRFGRFGIFIAAIINIVITMILVVAAKPSILSLSLVFISIVSALILAIFSGWKMKISHMRKSLNFGSEAVYNLWRVAIRILAPLLIIVAAIGWLIS